MLPIICVFAGMRQFPSSVSCVALWRRANVDMVGGGPAQEYFAGPTFAGPMLVRGFHHQIGMADHDDGHAAQPERKGATILTRQVAESRMRRLRSTQFEQ